MWENVDHSKHNVSECRKILTNNYKGGFGKKNVVLMATKCWQLMRTMLSGHCKELLRGVKMFVYVNEILKCWIIC